MTKIIINKTYFNYLLNRRYGKYIKDNKPSKKRMLLMLACEVNVTLKTLYNFQNNTYSTSLMADIINALDISEEEFYKLVEIKKEDQ